MCPIVRGIDDGRRAMGVGKQMMGLLSKAGKRKLRILRVKSKCSDKEALLANQSFPLM